MNTVDFILRFRISKILRFRGALKVQVVMERHRNNHLVFNQRVPFLNISVLMETEGVEKETTFDSTTLDVLMDDSSATKLNLMRHNRFMIYTLNRHAVGAPYRKINGYCPPMKGCSSARGPTLLTPSHSAAAAPSPPPQSHTPFTGSVHLAERWSAIQPHPPPPPIINAAEAKSTFTEINPVPLPPPPLLPPPTNFRLSAARWTRGAAKIGNADAKGCAGARGLAGVIRDCSNGNRPIIFLRISEVSFQ
ncbi:hypothetical protein GWI33_010412 [Rhynchophorus ferrugineus]|uniref:Uncharacterized protein n=1 Tax=Rhynchophorus ferrugineus TaxID=354439 RepID=A0A834IV26_RHYFE|nr:hypothetical protein GWI33_010412 [Rhynchophorus ferrugineus]